MLSNRTINTETCTWHCMWQLRHWYHSLSWLWWQISWGELYQTSFERLQSDQTSQPGQTAVCRAPLMAADTAVPAAWTAGKSRELAQLSWRNTNYQTARRTTTDSSILASREANLAYISESQIVLWRRQILSQRALQIRDLTSLIEKHKPLLSSSGEKAAAWAHSGHTTSTYHGY